VQTFYQILGLLGAGLVIFLLYRTVKGNPELFSKENLSKSSFTMAILAIGLIGFVALLILMLKYS